MYTIASSSSNFISRLVDMTIVELPVKACYIFYSHFIHMFVVAAKNILLHIEWPLPLRQLQPI